MIALLALASHPSSGFVNYLRPYIAAALVGITLFDPPAWIAAVLRGRKLHYIATVSFALYVIHHLFMFTWLLEGDRWIRYLKRPLLFALTFALAHLSTFYYEQRWIEFGKRLSDKLTQRRAARAAP